MIKKRAYAQHRGRAEAMYLDLFKLTGRIALVTGGGRGIGLACAEALAEAGARLTIADRDASLADQGRMTLRAKGYDADTVIMDVANSGRVTQVADEVVARYGRIDILVNSAGIARSETPAEKVTDEQWLNVLDVNLNSTFWCCRAFGSHMLQAQSGAIVNIGSMSGFIVNKPQEQSYYNASKAAVHHLTKSLAAEWAGGASASTRWRRPILPPRSPLSSSPIPPCTTPGLRTHRWPAWAGSRRSPRSCCSSHRMPRA